MWFARNIELMCRVALRCADLLQERGLESSDVARRWLTATLRWSVGRATARPIAPLTRLLRERVSAAWRERAASGPAGEPVEEKFGRNPLGPLEVLDRVCFKIIREARAEFMRGVYYPTEGATFAVAAIVSAAAGFGHDAACAVACEWRDRPYPL